MTEDYSLTPQRSMLTLTVARAEAKQPPLLADPTGLTYRLPKVMQPDNYTAKPENAISATNP